MKTAFLACLSFFIFCLAPSANLFSSCTCLPTTCALQPDAPCATPSASQYTARYSITGDHGAMTFIGNTLGLSKELCLNEPGSDPSNYTDAIGAFTTVDPTQMVGSYPSLTSGVGSPAGTTLTWQNNSSSAVLNLPVGITILYAELVWSGSYGYYCETPPTGDDVGVDPNCVLAFADGPINFTTADNQVHLITADPATAMVSQNPAPDTQPFYCAGNYVRSANVTSLFTVPSLANPNGTYIVGGVPATVSGSDDTHNAAGWTLGIIYRDPASANINNMTLFVAAQQGSRTDGPPASVVGFCAAPSETEGQSARLLVSAIEGDANKTGDHMNFGPTPLSLTELYGPNNPVDNFFCSQINDDFGALIDTTGTFCGLNPDPVTATLISGGRQGYDITNVDCSLLISPNQTQAFAQGSSTGDDYLINALGIQISVHSPVIVPIKKVNGQNNIQSNVGDTVTFTFVIDNTGLGGASNVFFQDILQPGLQLVPNTFMVNNVLVPNPDLVAGVPLGTIDELSIVNIQFQAQIISRPLSGNIFQNFATTPFDFIACDLVAPFHSSNNSNVVTITLPTPDVGPPPSDFIGVVKKCKYLNKTEYTLSATWVPSPLPNVVSYQIFKSGVLVATIPPAGPYVFETCLRSRTEAGEFSIVAVYPNGVESLPLQIRIINE